MPTTATDQRAIRQAFDAPRRTLEDIAAVMGVSVSAVLKYRNGERRMPAQARLLLAAYLTRQAAELKGAAAELTDTVD